MLNLANKITLLRILMTPLVVLLLYFEGPMTCILATLAFIFASLTDWADGYIARRSNMVTSMKPLDFIPLLYEDKKQSTRALRADVQNSSFGPEVLLASPLYDGTEFLGVVVANFDMRSLMFPRPYLDNDNLDFSFSGLKTAATGLAAHQLQGHAVAGRGTGAYQHQACGWPVYQQPRHIV